MSQYTLSSPRGFTKSLDYQQALNPEQLDVVLHGDGACLVLAGAGSGKTRTLTYRVAYLLEQGVDPSTVLLLTFTNKAAKEMLERVNGLLGGEARGLWGGTFHSIASRVLRSFAQHLGYTPSFTIMDSEDTGDLIKALIKEAGIDTKNKRFPSASVVHDVISYTRNVQSDIQTVLKEKYPHFFEAAPQIQRLADVYAQRKQSSNMMDFDDLLVRMVELLEDSQHGPAIAQRFRYVLVDEYQDTNALQARIVRGFAQVHKQVLVVGDDAQSIYAFRGANVDHILAFPKEWQNARVFKLLTNYRSTPQILEVANESLKHNVHQYEKELRAMGSAGQKPKLVPCQSATQEARYIADQIQLCVQRGMSLPDIAVLFRSSAHSQTLEFELMKRDLPYEYRGGQKFFERAHIKDAIAFLRIRHNVRDEVAWLRVLQTLPGVGATGAAQFARSVASCATFTEGLRSGYAWKGKARDGWKEFERMVQDIGLEELWPGTLLRRFASSFYKRYLEQEYPNWRERLEDLEQLALFAESYEDVSLFLGDIALYDGLVATRGDRGELDTRPRVVLSTIHQAKGLEWSTVFVMHLADQSFPSRRALQEKDGMEEERRLFYVAVTRARRELFLTYPLTLGYDTLQFQQPSTFIEELSPRYFDRVELREAFFRSGAIPQKRSFDEGDGWIDDEPVIEQDRLGNRAPKPVTAWKQGVFSTNKKQPPKSFLSSV
ncbi:ATP-dependent helicase [Patescibacteria group bacterium]|nr:ATP-dependent helicase [Patescibacteria group bacterium]